MSQYDFASFTESVVASIGPKASPRIRKCFPILIRKMHEFLIEADVTTEEWLAACTMLNAAGKVSSDKRDEMVLVTDVFGIESLVNTLDQTRVERLATVNTVSGVKAEDDGNSATFSAILGPFYRKGVPVQPNGTSIVRQDEPDGEYTYLHGTIHDHQGKPISGATIDVWHDAPDGFYDSQTPDKPEYHCRGRFVSDENGHFSTFCLRPVPYPIPFDHQAGQLLQLMDRHPMRPAHIHFWIDAPGHRTLITQLFDAKSDYLSDDSVFAVKGKLVVDFKPLKSKPTNIDGELESKLVYELEHDFHLERLEY